MTLYSVTYLLALAGTPTSIVVAWWLKVRHHEALSPWRSATLLIGLFSASIDIVIYYVWLPIAHRLVMTETPVWRVRQISGNVGASFLLVALLGAILGKGPSRIPLAACAILGLFLWLPVAVL